MSVGDGLGVSVGDDCVGADVDTDVGVDMGCEATSVGVGETEPVMDSSTLHPSSGDMASARPITQSKCLLGIITSPHINMFLDVPRQTLRLRRSVTEYITADLQ